MTEPSDISISRQLAVDDATIEEGYETPAMANSEAVTRKSRTESPAPQDVSGVVYVGRIPHGFYEHEMRSYFSQFGDIGHIRLSRSRKTGTSKHYAFIQFKSADVARIVADTMDTYLMFGHVLKCKLVAPGDVHEKMWRGAGKRFKKIPWNKIEGRRIEAPAGRSVWNNRVAKEKRRRSTKDTRLKETFGYSFETPVKGIEDVASRTMEDIGIIYAQKGKSLVTAGTARQDEAAVIQGSPVKDTRKRKETGDIVKKSSKRANEAETQSKPTKAKKTKKHALSMNH